MAQQHSAMSLPLRFNFVFANVKVLTWFLPRFNLFFGAMEKCLIFFLKGFGIEFLITMVLVLVVFAAAADENNSASVKVARELIISRILAFLEFSNFYQIFATGLCTSRYWTVHHNLPPFCHPSHWVQV